MKNVIKRSVQSVRQDRKFVQCVLRIKYSLEQIALMSVSLTLLKMSSKGSVKTVLQDVKPV